MANEIQCSIAWTGKLFAIEHALVVNREQIDEAIAVFEGTLQRAVTN